MVIAKILNIPLSLILDIPWYAMMDNEKYCTPVLRSPIDSQSCNNACRF